MKVLKLSWMGLLALVCFVFFYACKKDVSNISNTESEISGAIGTTEHQSLLNAADFSLTVTKISGGTTCEPLVLQALLYNPGDQNNGLANGTFSVMVNGLLLDADIDPLNKNSAIISIENPSAGLNNIAVHYEKNKSQQIDEFYSITITEITDCGGYTPPNCAAKFEAIGVRYVVTNCNLGYEAIYKVTVCGEPISNYKMQGGLTNGANYKYVSGIQSENSIKETGKAASKNTVITWNSIGFPVGETIFYVGFDKNKNNASTDWATGAWSLKKGSELYGGSYTDRLKFGVLTCN